MRDILLFARIAEKYLFSPVFYTGFFSQFGDGHTYLKPSLIKQNKGPWLSVNSAVSIADFSPYILIVPFRR